jgi:hypothetical protein
LRFQVSRRAEAQERKSAVAQKNKRARVKVKVFSEIPREVFPLLLPKKLLERYHPAHIQDFLKTQEDILFLQVIPVLCRRKPFNFLHQCKK